MTATSAVVSKTEELAELSRRVLAPNYGDRKLAFTHGEGIWLYTPEGDKYLDFLGGIAVCCLGHCHPHVVEAVQKQAAELFHVSNFFLVEPQVRLAALLVENTFAEEVFFCNSGAEANEAALKLAKKVAKDRGENNRFEVVSLQDSFHGRTIATLSATGQASLHEGFKPLLPGCMYVPANDVEAIGKAVDEKTCAVILEPIQGESGILPLTNEYMRLVREICTERGAMMIADEIQCGMGRTGTFLAHESAGIEPDIATLAKGLGNGLPIGAVLAKREIMGHFTRGSHGSTFGGNPITCAAALATVETIFNESLMEKNRESGEELFKGLKALKKEFPKRILDLRGRGLMIGVEMDEASAVHDFLLEHKVVVNCIRGKVIRLLPPYILTKADIDLFLHEFKAALEGTGA
jgi:predicted acetylornithine/succinylornithine family transaminase